MSARIPLFLCGEAHRSDDGVAFRAIRLLAPTVRSRARIIHAGQLDASDLVELAPGTPCIIVDALAGIAPGEVRALPLAEVAALGRARATQLARNKARSSHELALEQTLALAEILRGSPVDGWLVGIGIADVRPGETLSAAVAVALPALAAKLAAVIDTLAQSEALPC